MYPLIKDVYPERRDFVLGQLSGQLEAGQLTATTKQDKIGYIFIGNEGKNVAQCRLNGFSFSRLAPYETWEQLRDEARKLWATYWQIVGPAPIIRVAVRYINQIDIPLPFRDFRDFVRTYSEVSTDLSQNTQLNLPATKQPVAS